jgi:hypothetical protein
MLDGPVSEVSWAHAVGAFGWLSEYTILISAM